MTAVRARFRACPKSRPAQHAAGAVRRKARRRLSDNVTLRTIDSEPGIRPWMHVFTDSKAPWYEITDDLPRFRVYPGFEPDEEER